MKKNLKIINIFLASAISVCMLGGCESSMANTDSIPKEIVQVLKAGQNKNGDSTNYYYYDATKDGHKSVRSDVLTSDYYIFAGNKSEEEANNLISELNMMDKVQEWGSRVYVINPINGAEYTD